MNNTDIFIYVLLLLLILTATVFWVIGFVYNTKLIFSKDNPYTGFELGTMKYVIIITWICLIIQFMFGLIKLVNKS
jgi:hypothetical protein